MIELLAPAGDLNKLKTALHFGADAVYVGGNMFSLRANAKNFGEEEMIEAEPMMPAIPGCGPMYYSGDKESIHMAAGCGLKLIMNRNLIVSVDVGRAIDNRDGQKFKTFVGFNYTF